MCVSLRDKRNETINHIQNIMKQGNSESKLNTTTS